MTTSPRPDFESGELWTDNRGDWVRRSFVSRPDNVVVQYLTAPQGQTLNTTIAINAGGGGRGAAEAALAMSGSSTLSA
ncbi:MAG: hypothetical protein ABSH56_23785 [Bryobacteraceae bacterium]